MRGFESSSINKMDRKGGNRFDPKPAPVLTDEDFEIQLRKVAEESQSSDDLRRYLDEGTSNSRSDRNPRDFESRPRREAESTVQPIFEESYTPPKEIDEGRVVVTTTTTTVIEKRPRVSLDTVRDKIAFLNHTLKSHSLPQIGTFASIDELNPFLDDLNATISSFVDVMKMQASNYKAKTKLEERVAKAESDYKMSLKKIERLEDNIKEREKRIGELENQMYRTKTDAKAAPKKPAPDDSDRPKVGKPTLASSMMDHEIKKKDNEIFKLKETLKKSTMLHKDKVDISASKYQRFEINNFYEGVEREYNILDSRKMETYKKMLDECTDLRQTVMYAYEELRTLITAAGQTLRTKGLGMGSPGASSSNRLTWQLLNKPYSTIVDDVKMLFLECFNDLKKMILNTPTIK